MTQDDQLGQLGHTSLPTTTKMQRNLNTYTECLGDRLKPLVLHMKIYLNSSFTVYPTSCLI